MLRKIFFLFFSASLCFAFNIHAQVTVTQQPDPEYKHYTWDANPKLHELSADEAKRGEVVIKDKRILEYAFDDKDVCMYITRHTIVRVNSDKAIEENNTIYMGMGEGYSLVDVKARSISKDGKVTIMDEKNTKDVDNYEGLGHYKIFAIDGLEIGSEVEFIYTMKEPFKLYGTEYIRVNALIKDEQIDIYSPPYLIFATKSYNGFPDMLTDSTATEKHHVYMKAKDITGYDKETFSADNGALMRMEYAFAYNINNDAHARLYTYSDFCQKLFEVLDKGSTKQDKKAAEKVADTLKIRSLSDEGKIRYIESCIKNSVVVKEDVDGDQYRSLPDIFKNHVADDLGVIKLYHLVFDAANIKHEIVITSDRFDKPFDGDFDSWTYLQKYLIYFPTTNNYMAPTEIGSRYGFVPEDWICQKGLFIHAVTVGDYNTGVGKVKDLPCTDWNKSMSNITADTKFDLDQDMVNIRFKESFTGYEAYNLQPYYSYFADQDRKDFVDKFFKGNFEDSKPNNVKVSGYSETDLFRNPFVIEADFSTNTVLEKTGNKYLFKIGELIGPQSQLYRDTVRHTPIEDHHTHGYHRVLTFEIPDGYKVTNLDAVNMNIHDGTADDYTMEFHSFYSTDGNKVTVTIDEDYHQLRYPISMYEQFRKVINASADFNKVVLFLEKK
ncbi:MAG TPA: hypothetical protein VK806_00160 [Bacteroidia bacterium]|nr:hypothetical protein [Bacteroidia bacterium]